MDIQVLNNKLCELCNIGKKYEVHYTYMGDEEINVYEDVSVALKECEMLKGLMVETYPKLYTPQNLIELLKIVNDTLGTVHITSAYTGNDKYIFEEYVLMHCLANAGTNEALRTNIGKKEWT